MFDNCQKYIIFAKTKSGKMDKQKLYVKKEKGRYVEYKEPKQEWDNKLYRKIGKKYVPCSMLMTNDLGEGVWVVVKHKGSRSIISGKYLLENYMCLKASDIQDVSLSKLGGMERLSHYLSQHLGEITGEKSQYEYCRAIVGKLFNYENEK